MASIHAPGRRAFTIIELLVVIGIIAILITLGMLVAGKVGGAGKERVTQQTLRILDGILTAYIADNGGNPSPTVVDPRPTTGANAPKPLIPIIDGRNFTNPPVPDEFMNSGGLFLLQAKSVPAAHAMFKDIDPKLMREYDADGADPNPASPDFGRQPMLLTAFDGWGNPIRYVHPAFRGSITDSAGVASSKATDRVLGAPPAGHVYGINRIRRTGDREVFTTGETPLPADEPTYVALDSDEGVPTSNRPYFYSCGPDGVPDWNEGPTYGTLKEHFNDNIYLDKPKFVKR